MNSKIIFRYIKLVFFIFAYIQIFPSTYGQNNSPFTHEIGEYFQGGVIFHLWIGEDKREHGLIVSVKNQDTNAVWSNVCTTIMDNVRYPDGRSSLKDGKMNSFKAITMDGHIYSAAQACADYSFGGFADWYLPSLLELNLLATNRGIVNYELERLNDSDKIVNAFYLSSSDCRPCSYLGVEIFGNNSATYRKSKNESVNNSFVRAIRRF